ncbi:DUF5667 domain-containing protein [Amycolatopsis sp. EV170708-02-1]|uniref:DUF5667 domain-containing protein n=1 Tax=Amycolatopsis sp. EV170708-02-1 TaxID=2919322 RepID=UPI001F0CA3CA|nr:DUF5667 domain-containing protein [Amycolatopsis sp. EV170708-02-1]UMP02369.1 DUF5667 domain-containing protein [Amycolatopsis sp. EV170708-02-1]
MGVPGWFARERADGDRFADLVDGTESPDDDEFAHELALVGGLRELGAGGAPDAETRQRIRDEIAGRLAEAEAAPKRRGHAVANLAAAAVALVLALGGITLLLSKDALPGDPLYGIKRAGESASLGLTFDEHDKAKKHLEFAANRVGELDELTRQGAPTDAYFTGLADFETDLRAGVSQLTALVTDQGGQARLAELRTWARNQSDRLGLQVEQAPAEARDKFSAARALLDKVQERTTDLGSRLVCYTITTGTSDELGAVPAAGDCVRNPDSPDAVLPPVTSSPPSSAPSATPTPTSAPPSSAVDTATPTGPLAPPTGGTPPPVVATPPPTTRTVPPTTTTRPPPLVSIPPLIPGLPPIIIG